MEEEFTMSDLVTLALLVRACKESMDESELSSILNEKEAVLIVKTFELNKESLKDEKTVVIEMLHKLLVKAGIRSQTPANIH